LLDTMYELPSMKDAKTVLVDEQVINDGKTPEIA
jgi:ATP-dependent Clp protease ATP-binding subunit ClpX